MCAVEAPLTEYQYSQEGEEEDRAHLVELIEVEEDDDLDRG